MGRSILPSFSINQSINTFSLAVLEDLLYQCSADVTYSAAVHMGLKCYYNDFYLSEFRRRSHLDPPFHADGANATSLAIKASVADATPTEVTSNNCRKCRRLLCFFFSLSDFFYHQQTGASKEVNVFAQLM